MILNGCQMGFIDQLITGVFPHPALIQRKTSVRNLHLGIFGAMFCPSHLKTVGGDICVTATVIELPLAGATGIVALAGLATIYLSPLDMWHQLLGSYPKKKNYRVMALKMSQTSPRLPEWWTINTVNINIGNNMNNDDETSGCHIWSTDLNIWLWVKTKRSPFVHIIR